MFFVYTGSFITIYLFSKRWRIDDSIIGVIACLSRIAASLVYAIAPSRTVYFLGPVLDMFSSAGATSLRSIATKLVNDDEVGEYNNRILTLYCEVVSRHSTYVTFECLQIQGDYRHYLSVILKLPYNCANIFRIHFT